MKIETINPEKSGILVLTLALAIVFIHSCQSEPALEPV